MTELFKTTKPQGKARAIDSIVKFQIDDGIESLTIGGKEALADLSYDKKGNVTLHFNADKDKIDEIVSLVPFVSVESDVVNDKHTVALNLDMREFDIKVEGSELVVVKKTKTDITLDLTKIQEKFDEIERKLGEHTEKIKEAEKKIEENGNKIAENLSKINENKAKIQEIVNELVEVGKKIAKNEGDIAENLEKIKSNKTELDKQLAMIEDTNAEVAEAKKAISKNADDIVEQAKKIGELQEKDKTLERRINQTDDNIDRVEQDLAVTDSKATELGIKLNSEVEKLKGKDEVLEVEIGNLKEKDTELQVNVANVDNKLNDYKEENNRALESVKSSVTENENKFSEFKSDYESDKNSLAEKVKKVKENVDKVENDFNESQRIQDERIEKYNNERKAKEEQLENSAREIIKLLKVNKPSEEDKSEIEEMLNKVNEKINNGAEGLEDLQDYLNELKSIFDGGVYDFEKIPRLNYARTVRKVYDDSEVQAIVEKVKNKYYFNKIDLFNRLQEIEQNLSDIESTLDISHLKVKSFNDNIFKILDFGEKLDTFQSVLGETKEFKELNELLNNLYKVYSREHFPITAFENFNQYKKEYDNKDFEKLVGEIIDYVNINLPDANYMDDLTRIYHEIRHLIDTYKIKNLDLSIEKDYNLLNSKNPELDGRLMVFLTNYYGLLEDEYLNYGDIRTNKYYSKAKILTNNNITVNNEKLTLKDDFTTKILGYYNSDRSIGKSLKSFLFEDTERNKFYISNIGIQKAINNTVVCIYIHSRYFNNIPKVTNCEVLNVTKVTNGTIMLVKMKNLGQAVIEF